jgi:hypothetical protein
MPNLPKFLKKGGSMPNNKSVTDSVRKTLSGTTPLWIGATVVFAALFFLSSVLDMKVKVSFGPQSAATTGGSVNTINPGTVTPAQSAPAGGIASQVGGC